MLELVVPNHTWHPLSAQLLFAHSDDLPYTLVFGIDGEFTRRPFTNQTLPGGLCFLASYLKISIFLTESTVSSG